MPRPPRSVLLVCPRRLGDALMITPLARSLVDSFPGVAVDALVGRGAGGMLAGNPDFRRVDEWPEKAPMAQTQRLLGARFGAYDAAVAMVDSDRATLAARWCGRRAWGGNVKLAWRALGVRAVPVDRHRVHAAGHALMLATALGAVPRADLVPPVPTATERAALAARLGAAWGAGPWRYAVVHPAALLPYKAWPVEAWEALVAGLRARGLKVAVTGGPAATDRGLAARLCAGRADTVDLAGVLPLPALTPLLAGAAVFVGPDTSVTHQAAAAGAPTVAVFGPTWPLAWGPWPRGLPGDARTPWQVGGRLVTQARGTVRLVQGPDALTPGCMPCARAGCEDRADGPARCLPLLPAARVLGAVDELLAGEPGRPDYGPRGPAARSSSSSA